MAKKNQKSEIIEDIPGQEKFPFVIESTDPPKEIKINAIFQSLTKMPIWEKAGIAIYDRESHIEFQKGGVLIIMSYQEFLLFGVKVIFEMFKCLEK